MKITKITIWKIALTSHVTYYMAEGKTCDRVDSFIVRLQTDEGLSGWGEVCPIAGYLPAYAGGVTAAIENMAPIILGANSLDSYTDPIGVEALMARLNMHLMGHPYAKSPIDIALWDLTAQQAKMPLYCLLGGRRQKNLPLYHSISCVAPEEMQRMAQNAYAQGMRQFQVKLGVDQDWRTDIARLRAVREAVEPSALVFGDWNMGATRLEAVRVGREVADLDLMFEQPCKTLEECAAVRHITGLPMKIDENAHDLASLLRADQLNCLDAVAIKLSKFGGISASRRARDLCEHLGVMTCIEDVWGSDIVTAALLHLAVATTPKNLLNSCDLSHYVTPHIGGKGQSDLPMRHQGRIAPPEGIGLGVTPDLDILGKEIAIFD